MTYHLTLDKTSTDVASVTGTITVTNPSGNPVSATVSSVVDAWNGVNATVDCPAAIDTLAPGETVHCTYSIPLSAALKAALPIATMNNTATVTTTGPVPGNAATMPVSWNPGPTYLNGSEPETVHLTDANDWPLATSGTTRTSFDQGASFSADTDVTYSETFDCRDASYDQAGHAANSYDNRADINETADFDTWAVTVNCTLGLSPLAVSNTTGSGHFDRTVTWSITKTADDSLVELADNEHQDVNYDVHVEKSEVKSDIFAGGTFTITNPNSIGIQVHSVGDSLITTYGGSIACKLNGSGAVVTFDYTLPAGQFLVCAYETPHTLPEGLTTGSVSNQASVQATNTALNATSSSAPLSFVEDSLTGADTVDVEDNIFNPPNWTHIGTASDSFTFEYAITMNCSGVDYTGGLGQKTVTNTARIPNLGNPTPSSTRGCRRRLP